MSSEVLPCPFCENEDIIKTEKFTGNYRYGKPVYIVFMKCSLCEAATRSFSYIVDNEAEKQNAEIHALKAWNKRGSNSKETKLAHWEIERDGNWFFALCSNCNEEFPYDGVIEYCPSCKSKMNTKPVFCKEEKNV